MFPAVVASLLVLLSLLFLPLLHAVTAQEGNDTVQLHFLNILPYPSSQPNAGWDRAYELIPAAELAVDHINNASDLLPGYKLNLVRVESEACGLTFINEGLINPYEKIFQKEQHYNVVGVGGLFCSTVTNTVAALFSSSQVTYLQLAGSTTPVHRNSSQFPWLVHFVSSSITFNDAVMAMMKAFDWHKISIIYDTSGIFFTTSAVDFLKRAERAGIDIITAIPLPVNYSESKKIFQILTNSRARVIYVIAPSSKCAMVLCEAYKNKALYPGYVYIFHDKTVAGIVDTANSTSCNETQLMEVFEGVFLINYNLAADEDTKLASNVTYTEYHEEYLSRVSTLESSMNLTSYANVTPYANVMYDQMWAIALALQGSLGKLQDKGIDLADIQLHQSNFIANTLRSEMRNVSFQGASGYISFNSDIEENSLVTIFQVNKSREEPVGEFHGEFNKSSCSFAKENDRFCLLKNCVQPPPDTFETRILLLPTWVFAFINGVVVFCVVMTTLIFLFLYVLLRARPEVKASSLSLSIVMYIGCYFVFAAALVRNVSRGYEMNSSTFTTACNLEIWLSSIGMTLVFSALLMRLLRIYNIFKTYGRVSTFWKDRYLILCILAICSGEILLLLVWTVTDKIRYTPTTTYQPTAIPPYFETHSTCSCSSVGAWLLVVFSYNGVLMGLVVLMAVQTRKIKRSNFKDTKKTNAFIAITCMSVIMLLSLRFVLDMALQNHVGGHMAACFAFLCTGVYCQLFLFLPLIIVALTRRNVPKKRRCTRIDKAQEIRANAQVVQANAQVVQVNQEVQTKTLFIRTHSKAMLFTQLFHGRLTNRISTTSTNTDIDFTNSGFTNTNENSAV